MLLRPPTSTLFPYTTLFRSVLRLAIPLEGETVCVDALRGPITVANQTVHDPVLIKSDGFPTYHLAAMDRIMHCLVGDSDRDRKSTRLNSSHSQISYAVFCLK